MLPNCHRAASAAPERPKRPLGLCARGGGRRLAAWRYLSVQSPCSKLSAARLPSPPPQPTDFSQARKWVQVLRDIENPLTDLPGVKKGVRGLLEVCKNGACVALRARCLGLPCAHPCCCSTRGRKHRHLIDGGVPLLAWVLLRLVWVLTRTPLPPALPVQRTT